MASVELGIIKLRLIIKQYLILNDKNLRILFYSIWSMISVIQAAFTDLLFDEAYYWKYQTQLAWGYFDHPPMIAWLIKPGYWLLGNDLGVRLSIIILTPLLIFLLEKLIKPQNLKLFYTVVSSIAVFHFIGFLALPDLPLLFFTALFFFRYNYYLESDSIKNSVILAIVIALLLYSKYHGLLVVFFVVLSNFKLLRKRSFWLVTFVSLILYLPHILWQYQHDWVSLRFHLVERRYNDYLPRYTLEYLLSQFVISGPLVGVPLIWFFIKSRSKNLYTKALKFTGYGFYIFFFISSFKGHVEANWTFPALIPLIILGYPGIENNLKTKKFIYRAFPITLILIFALRIYLIYDYLPQSWHVKTDFHHWRAWAGDIKKHTKGNVVVFANSYQKAAVYEYYSGNPSFSFNNIWGRKNQYSIWEITKNKCWENNVALIHNFPVLKDDSLKTKTETVYIHYVKNFMIFPFVKITPEQKLFKAKPGENLEIKYSINMNHEYFQFDDLGVESRITFELYAHDFLIKSINTGQKLTDNLIDTGKGTFTLKTPDKPDIYYISISIQTGALPPTINSYKYKLVVE